MLSGVISLTFWKTKMTELCEIAYEYKTDKCPKVRHSYTPIYHEMFKDKRNDVKKLLEVGVGSLVTMNHVKKQTGYDYTVGASLLMWRDYFPNAQVYGSDIDPDAMVKGEERVTTFLSDETKEKDIKSLVKQIGSDIDIVVDDGEHVHTAQLFLAKTILPLLKKDVVYIIEDVYSLTRVMRPLREAGYECEAPELSIKNQMREHIIIVKNK